MKTTKNTKENPHPNWGGKREGAGRKCIEDVPVTHTIAFRVTESTYNMMQRAKAQGVNVRKEFEAFLKQRNGEF